MQNCMDGRGVSWPKRCAYIWSSEVPTQMSEPWVCFGWACVRKTALERKWSPPISGVVKASAWTAVGVADDGEPLLEGTQRRERALGENLEVLARGGRRVEVLRRAPLVAAGQAMHLLDTDEAGRTLVGTRVGAQAPGGDHGVEQRQRGRGPESPQEGAARDVVAGDEVHGRQFSLGVSRGGPVRVAGCSSAVARGARFILNASLFTTPSTREEML